MKSFFRENVKYFVAGTVLIVVMIYSGFVPNVEKISENKDIFEEEDVEEVREADLDKNNQSKVYRDILNSKKDDFYRLTFRAKSLKDEEVLISIISKTGVEKEIGKIELLEGSKTRNFEFIFDTDDHFSDIIFKRQKFSDESGKNMISDGWDSNKIYISQINVFRLNVENRDEALVLEKTVFGDTNSEIIYLSSSKKSYNLSDGEQNFCRSFNFSSGLLSSVIINVDQMGNGGGGDYRLEIRNPKEGNNVAGKLIKKKNFDFKDLARKLQEDGKTCKFDFSLKLEESKEYFVCINNEKAGVDNSNYLRVNTLEGKDIPEKSIFGLEVRKTFVVNNKAVSNNAKIEDLGRYQIYEYENSRSEMDILDIYDQKGDLKFNEREKAITGKAQKGNFFTYKIDTIYSFESLRVELKKINDDKGRVKLEYSFDNENWERIKNDSNEEPEDFEKKSHDYDFVVENKDGDNTEFYIRVSYTESSKSKGKVFGLEELRVTAKL